MKNENRRANASNARNHSKNAEANTGETDGGAWIEIAKCTGAINNRLQVGLIVCNTVQPVAVSFACIKLVPVAK